MMLTILGLPRNTKYHDLKVLIKQECKIGDFILDNLLTDEDGSKKVRIGLSDEREGVHLIKCLDGYRMSGNILRVVPVGKQSQSGPQQNLDMRGGYNQHHVNQPGPDYNRPPSLMQGKHSPWMQNTNQWTPNQNMGNQPLPSHLSNTFGASSYQPQNQVSNTPYMQQQGPQQQRPDTKFGQNELYGEGRSSQGPGYGFPPKNNVPAHTNFYHGNTQYNMMHSQPNQNLGQYQVQGHQGQPQPSAWLQQVQQQKQPIFSPQSKVSPTSFNKRDFNDARKFPEPSKTPNISKGSHDNYKNYNKSGRFSPQPSKHPHRMDSPPGKRISPSGRRISPSGRRMSPSGPPGRRGPSPGRRLSPPGRRMSPSERRQSPPGRRLSPSGRRITPPGRRISPSARRNSPSARRTSPSARRISPSGRRISPPGRRVSPSARRLSPFGHRNSPSGRDDRRIPIRHSPARDSPRRHSPHRNLSPNRRPGSPDWRTSVRRNSPQMHNSLRYSPSRLHPDKQADKYVGHDSQGPSKLVTPAYDSVIKASNRQMYTGGYQPNLQEKVQYPIPGPRKGEPSTSSWKDKEKLSFSITGKKEEDRRDISRMQSFEVPRGTELRVDRMDSAIESKRGHSPSRKSRSPMRRERSPLRDRYRRHSPSPRSPRRSWALEKRRSPDIREAPPPPVWPGQNRETEEYARTNRPSFNRPDTGDKQKHISVWESVSFKEKDERDARRSEEKQRFQPLGRNRSDLPSTTINRREPSPRGHFKPLDERFPQREQKGSLRDDFERRDSDFRRSDDERKYNKDFRDMPQRMGDNLDRHRQDFQREEYNIPEEGRRREGYRKGSEELSKEIEDIHRRAIEFRKKAEEHRRNEERRKEYAEEKDRHDPADRHNTKHYNDRSKNIFGEEDRRREEIRNEYRLHESDDRLRQNDRPFSRHFDEHKKESEPKWTVDEMAKKPMAAAIKSKRDNAAKEIAQKIFKRKNLPADGDQNRRVFEELKHTLWRILYTMFGDDDVSFIELVIKFNAKYGDQGEDKIFNDVMSSFSNKMRKRQTSEGLDFTSKISRRTPEGDMNKGVKSKPSAVKQISNLAPINRLAPKPQRGPMRSRYPIKPLKNVMKVEKKPKMPTKLQGNVPRVAQAAKEAKTLPKNTEDVKQSVPESKKVVTVTDETTKKKLDETVSVEPNPDGHYELNSLMTRMVEAELQTILIKIWQELPDNPSSDAEKLVVDIMKNKASDDLRNVLGLNVTKRLLNIHNPLYVKLKFSLKPDGLSLKNFLSEYNISAFKRIDESVDIFAAQLETINDFDRICLIRNLRCGNAKVTITPCYKFLHCPSNLKTIFNESNEKNKSEEVKNSTDNNETAKETKNNENLKTSQEKQNDKDVVNTTNIKPKKDNDSAEVKTEITKDKQDEEKDKCQPTKLKSPEPKSAIKTNIKPKKDNDSAEVKTEITKDKQDEEKDKCQPTKLKSPETISAIKEETNTSTNKVVSNRGVVQTKTIANSDIKINVNESKVETSSEKADVKETIEKTSIAKSNLKVSNVSSEKANVNESNIKDMSEDSNLKKSSVKIDNTKADVKESNKNTAIQKRNVKESGVKTTNEKDNVKKPNVNVANEKTKIKDTNVNITKANVKKSNVKMFHEKAITKSFNKNKEIRMELDEHDDDELDDNDILALMSEAIILDECSGSDED